MKARLFTLFIFSAISLGVFSCSSDKEPEEQPQKLGSVYPSTTKDQGTKPDSANVPSPQIPLPRSDRHYVLDKMTKTLFEIDLNTNTVSKRFAERENVVAVAYDAGRDWVFEALGPPETGLRVFDPKKGKPVQVYSFPDPPSDLLFHPLKRLLFIVSEDSTYLRVYSPDSAKFILNFPLEIMNHGVVGPRTLGPGPAGRLICANGARASVTKIQTDDNYMYQTILLHEAKFIDNAVFSFDGNAFFACDASQGTLYHIAFGSGDVLGKVDKLDKPRFVQLEVTSNTVVVVVGNNEVLMLHPDTFRETGKVSLSQYGDKILSMTIPPKANFAEVLMDYKGVTRWIRFDVQNWEPLRLVELI